MIMGQDGMGQDSSDSFMDIKEMNMKEIEFLLLCLIDSSNSDSRRMILQRLLEIIPAGHHPLIYTESVNDPAVRLVLREHHTDFLNDVKLRFDLKQLIQGRGTDIDLESGAFLISRLGDERQITPEDFRHKLDLLARPLKNILGDGRVREHREIVDIFRNYLFTECGFHGNTENYYDPRNSFITEVLRTKTGIPVSLSVLCLLLGRRLNLPLEGINLPGHFIIRYFADDYSMYMDPFNDGNLLTEEDCLNFLTRQSLDPSPEYLARATSATIMKRMYRNLINFYSSNGDSDMEKKLRQHFSILENSSIHS